MNEPIKWKTEWDQALAQARTEKKGVLLEFYNPE